MRKCYQCFNNYDENNEKCPYCGYQENCFVTEARYLAVGTVLKQRYLIGIVIGSGGFGVTYNAWDKILDQKVAIKEYLPGEFSTRGPGQTDIIIYGGEKTEQFNDGKMKFFDESKHLAIFRDVPGIVQIFDCFGENGTMYIVMEYLEGETLETHLKKERKLSEQETIRIMTPILQALEIVHKDGILHRDIAPNNIFLANDGKVKLLDFGASRSVTGSHSKSLTVLYKEGYTPEEQYRSRGDQGPWTDVYACAATMYRMLTGEIPQGALERRVKDKLKQPSHNGTKISRNVESAIMNALNVDIKYRTQNADMFLKELHGDNKTKKHFSRTVERKIGEIPLTVKIIISSIVTFSIVIWILLFFNVIHMDVGRFSNYLIPDGKTRVPNLINKEIEKAEVVLSDNDLEMEITDKEYSNKIPKGRVLSQSIKPGNIADQGGRVTVIVSGGPKTKENNYKLQDNEVYIPDVEYKNWKDAIDIVKEAGLTAQYQFDVDDSVESGIVIRQSQSAGNVAMKGDSLLIFVNLCKMKKDEEGYIPSSMDGDFLEVINKYRQEEGLAAITYNSKLQKDVDELVYQSSHGNESMILKRVCCGVGYPTYCKPEEIISVLLGENIAYGVLDADVNSVAVSCYYNPKGAPKFWCEIMFDKLW